MFNITPTMAANTYSDVNPTHWAYKHVVKMDFRNVVAGYTDGSFKPDNAVTQLEAVLLAVRNMELDKELNQLDSSRTLPFTVPEWAEKQAKKELLLAIDKGLIIPAEKDFSADKLASRAWMTRLMVRMIGKDSEAALNANNTSKFTDTASFADKDKGYINTAVKYGLIAGFPDGTFKAAQLVTRAQTVVLLGNSEQHLTLTRTIKGKVISNTGSSLTVSVNGLSSNYIGTADSVMYDTDSYQIPLTSVKAGQEVLLVASNNNIKYLEILTESDAPIAVATISGTLIKVLAEQNVVIVKDNTENIHTKHVAQGVQCVDTAGRVYPLDQIPLNVQVTLSLDAQGFVNGFTLESAAGLLSNAGVIYEIDTKNNLIILKNLDNFSTYQYSDFVEVVVEGLRFAAIQDLRPGDEVKLETENSIVNKITLVKTKQELTITGTVVMNDKEVLVIKKEDGTFETFKVASNCKIDISGLDIARISDVLEDDKVSLEVKDGLIVNIKVNNRSLENGLRGTVVAIDSTSSTLVLENSDGKLNTYVIAKYADIVIDNIKNAALSDVKKGMKIDIELLDNKIIYIANKNTIEGVILTVNSDRNLISIKTDTEGSVTYRVHANVDVEIEDNYRATLEDVERNDIVELKVANDFVTEIYVERSYIYEVTSVSSNSLRVLDEKNNSKYLDNDDKPKVIISGISQPAFKDFKAGDLIQATFKGLKLVKCELIPANAGEVLSINSSTRSLSILGFDGKITSLDVSNRLTITKDDKTYNNLSVITSGDRIKVKTTANNETYINIMSKLRTQFVDTEQNDTKLYITRNSGYSYVVYDIANPCYVHKGNQVYSFYNLRENDWVNIYYIDKVVYEVEKE